MDGSHAVYVCGHCEGYLNRRAPIMMTDTEIAEVETRLSQGWALKGDLRDLLSEIKRLRLLETARDDS